MLKVEQPLLNGWRGGVRRHRADHPVCRFVDLGFSLDLDLNFVSELELEFRVLNLLYGLAS